MMCCKIDSVRQLLMRDFDANGPIVTVDDGRICNEIIVDEGGYAKFRHQCCFNDSITGIIDCTTDIGNFWLNLLYVTLTIVRFGLLFFGPSLFISAIQNMSKNNYPYVVKLKAKLEKVVCFSRGGNDLCPEISTTRTLDLRSKKGFPKLRNCVQSLEVPVDQPIRVRFPQYDILVDYKRTLKENTVPVGLFQSLFSTLCKCQIRFVGPFKECCKANIFWSNRRVIQWGKCFRKFAKVLLILLVPTPFYLRLIIFYVYEYESLQDRKRATAASGLKESFENSVVHYFTPTHGVFVVMYLIYIAMAVVLAFMSRPNREHRVKKIIVESFKDLKRLNWTDTLSVVVSNVIWPFKKFGMLGFFVGLLYWPIAVPISLLIAAAYFIPTIYLTVRMGFHSKIATVVKARRSHRKTYKVRENVDQDMYRFETDNVISTFTSQEIVTHESTISLDDLDHIKPTEHMIEPDEVSRASTIIYASFRWQRITKYVLCGALCIVSLYSSVIIMSDVIGCLVEIAVFTIMGCIVNASSLLRYVMLIVMVFVYSCDCFNNMSKQYLKMNKTLFGEVKGRIKDLDKVTSLPSSLQENCGFKAQELNEQAAYEGSDDVATKPPNHWMINDLVLFVDSEDTPRIPKQLFDEVTQIRVAGVPGPVFRGHLEALRQLFRIVLFIGFVFIIVLSFGAVYKVSSTNQTLATVVGGFLPMILRMFLAPPAPNVEMGTVSFKSKMDEVIKNFCQYWPIHDLPFELISDDDDDGDTKDAADKDDDSKMQAASSDVYANNNDEAMYVDQTCLDEFDGANQFLMQPRSCVPTYSMSTNQQVCSDAAQSTKKRVKIEEPESNNKVDILILLPERDGQWLLE